MIDGNMKSSYVMELLNTPMKYNNETNFYNCCSKTIDYRQ